MFLLKLDKKIITAFVLIFVVAAGTALASYMSTTTTQSISIGSNPAISTVTTTTSTFSSKGEEDSPPRSVVITTASPDATLANIIFRVLGIPVTVTEITTLRTYNMGYGEITLAYNLASASGRSVNEILDMRFQQKMGWGKIAKVLGVKLHGPADKSVYILRESQLEPEIDAFNVIIKVDLDDEDRDSDDRNNHEKHDDRDHHEKDGDFKQDKSHKSHGKGNDKHE